MSRLIEVQFGDWDPSHPINVQVGDVLRFAASGGRVRGGSAVELVGIFTEGLVGTSGEVISPIGAPNTVLFRAKMSGSDTIDVVIGDPWNKAQTKSIAILVTR